MIKSFFFSTNFVPPLLLSGSCRTPSPIDRHAEEITLIAGITSPHVGWPHTGQGGGSTGDGARCAWCASIWREGGRGGEVRYWKSGPMFVYCLWIYWKMKTAIISGCLVNVIRASAVHIIFTLKCLYWWSVMIQLLFFISRAHKQHPEDLFDTYLSSRAH